MRSNKYSGLAQSHASLLTTTTRALISTPSTGKLHGRIQENQLLKLMYKGKAQSSYMLPGHGERRHKTKVSGSRKERAKDVSATNQSTYNSVSEARESKMPGGSSDRSFTAISLKATRDEIDQNS